MNMLSNHRCVVIWPQQVWQGQDVSAYTVQDAEDEWDGMVHWRINGSGLGKAGAGNGTTAGDADGSSEEVVGETVADGGEALSLAEEEIEVDGASVPGREESGEESGEESPQEIGSVEDEAVEERTRRNAPDQEERTTTSTTDEDEEGTTASTADDFKGLSLEA